MSASAADDGSLWQGIAIGILLAVTAFWGPLAGIVLAFINLAASVTR